MYDDTAYGNIVFAISSICSLSCASYLYTKLVKAFLNILGNAFKLFWLAFAIHQNVTEGDTHRGINISPTVLGKYLRRKTFFSPIRPPSMVSQIDAKPKHFVRKRSPM